MAHIPPSAPHLPRLARPAAVCHANSIVYESGADTSPPGKTDGTFQLHRQTIAGTVVRQTSAEKRGVKKKAGGSGEGRAHRL